MLNQPYGKAALRASLAHFLFGKACNAIISVATLIGLARWMTTDDYGAYVTLVALQALLLAISNLGIEATAERFLPEFRTRYADAHLLGFVLTSLGLRLFTLLLVAVGGFFASDLMSDSLRLAELDGVLQFWLLAVACYGALCFACVLLEAMLKQKQAQACMSVYLATKLFLIFLLQKWWAIDLLMLVGCEVIAALFSSVLAIMLLTRLFHRQGLRTGWLLVNENRDRLQRFAIFNYAAQCVFQLFSTDSLKLLVTRLIGLAGSASFGFSANLADMVQRYLPATLLQRLIKPVFVSRYVKSGDFGELNQMARIILKLNLLILVPVIAVVIVYGGEILALLTHGKYANGHWLFVGTLCLLIPSSHQAVLGLLASTLERNGMQFYAGLLTSVGFPIALVLIPNFGPIGAVFAAALSAVIYNTAATAYLRRAGFDYRPDFRVFCIFGILGGLMVAFLESSKSWLDGEFAQLAAMTLCVFLYLVLVRRLSVFSSAERAMMNAVLPKPIFIF